MQIEYNPDLILTQEHTAAEIRNYTGSFCGFVLLREPQYDLAALAERLQKQGIAVTASGAKTAFVQDLMLDVSGAMVTISLFPEPIPDGEAEAASVHAKWDGAQAAAENHKAHLMIAVLPDTLSAMDAGHLYCRILSAASQAPQALAAYTSGTILAPAQFQQYWEQSADALLLDTLIYIGTYSRDGGNCGYTVGMDAFGKDELEILDCEEPFIAIEYILQECAKRILTDEIPTGWYFTADMNGITWEGRRRDGVMVEGHSIQLTRLFSD